MRALYLLAALLSAGEFGAADLGKLKDNAKAGANVEGVAHVQPIGTTASKGPDKALADAWSKAYLKGGVSKLAAPEAKQCVINWINSYGCVPMKDGSRKPLNAQAYDAVLAATAGSTEHVFNAGGGFMLRVTKNSNASAMALSKELKKLIEESESLQIGSPNKNAIVWKFGSQGLIDGKAPGPQDDGAKRAAHELLHVLLRQFDNPDVGGGANKGNACKEIGNRHHQLVNALRLQDANETTLPAFDCGAPAAPGCAPAPLPADCKPDGQ